MSAANLDSINRLAIELCLKELVSSYDTAALLEIMAQVCADNAVRADRGWFENGSASAWKERARQIAAVASELASEVQPAQVMYPENTLLAWYKED